MIPYLVDPDVEHKPDYRCCEVVRAVVASAALDGRTIDADYVTTLHRIVMGELRVEEVIAIEVRRAGG